MEIRKLFRVATSTVVVLPQGYLRHLKLGVGDQVQVTLSNTNIKLTKLEDPVHKKGKR